MRPDEIELLRLLHLGRSLEAAQSLLAMPYKRLLYILNKWSSKGWWEFGVHPTRGWLTKDSPDG